MLSLHNGACATPVYVLFDTGTDTISFVNRKVSRREDNSDSMTVGIAALAGTSLTSSTYRSVSFFNELSELNKMIVSIKAKVIDSCLEVIIGRPLIRSHHLTRKIPSYFDEVESRCQSNQEARPVSTPVLATHVHTLNGD